MPLLKLHGDRLLPAIEEAKNEVSLEDWRSNRVAHADATALVIPNDADITDLCCDVSGFSTIILEFPAFKDGRAYSQARLLRDRIGYTGEIRARGDVLRDQLLYMVRCGVNGFECTTPSTDAAETALSEFSFVYQTSADGAEPVWKRRLDRAAAA